ncbi:MAG: tripartite tricarboxylate transporter substrate binding protein [Pseudomonadota bacterium]
MKRRDTLQYLAASGLGLIPALGRAANFPTKPLRMVVPFTPGGSTDLVARAIAPRLAEALGQPVVIDNKPGASTVIASEIVAKSPPDGHTLLLTSVPLVTNPWLMKSMPYETPQAFAAISNVVVSPFILVVPANSPITSFSDFIARAKAGKLSYASTGSGTADHLAMELVCLQAGISMVHVAYKGTAPALTDVMGGHVQAMFANVVGSAPMIKAGKLRALATSTAQRSPLLPDVRTVAEVSGTPFDVGAWTGLLAPAGTDPAIVAQISTELQKIVKVPATRELLISNGTDPVGSNPADFQAFITRELATWGKIIRTAGITAN